MPVPRGNMHSQKLHHCMYPGKKTKKNSRGVWQDLYVGVLIINAAISQPALRRRSQGVLKLLPVSAFLLIKFNLFKRSNSLLPDCESKNESVLKKQKQKKNRIFFSIFTVLHSPLGEFLIHPAPPLINNSDVINQLKLKF